MSNEGVVHSATDGGTAGAHPSVPNLEVMAGTSTDNERNSVKTAVIPIACWRVDDVRFEFDSSFVRPEIAEEMKSLAELREEHKKEIKLSPTDETPVAIFPPLSIFGHADPTGNDDYNKGLSGRRATAIYAMLTRDTDLWEELYSKPVGGDKWGVKATQVMLNHLGFSNSGATGQMDQQTREDVKKFQKVKGLTADGDPGPKTRKVLFLAYMDSLCGADFVLDKKDDFLGRGADKDGKGDYQGCSEFNPVMVFSKAESQEFAKPQNKPQRDKENAPNRRVMVLLFRPGSRVSVEKWPCPRAKEGVVGCKKRFWSDGETRRGNQLERREFKKTKDTFACRFYDRLADKSPCESLGKLPDDCFIFLKLFDDNFKTVLTNQEYELRGQLTGKRISARSTSEGIVRHELIPDDHYELVCGGKRETVEVYYMIDKEEHEDKPWFMRVRGFEVVGAADQPDGV